MEKEQEVFEQKNKDLDKAYDTLRNELTTRQMIIVNEIVNLEIELEKMCNI